MTQSLDALLISKLLQNPDLLKKLEKTAATPSPQVPKKKKDIQPPAYVNQALITCSLCGSETLRFYSMSFDPNLIGYTTNCHSDTNLWPELPLRLVKQWKPDCPYCFSRLLKYDKEELIIKMIDLSRGGRYEQD